ncbi:MAG: hypothetical protein K8J08_14955 [Thermoanaerobaculia bacterium]|nr:hypothetical protein [Thermoanaerobaculia bacterium]
MSLSDQLKNLEHLVSNAMGTALEDAERTLSHQIRKLAGTVQQRAEEQALDRLHDSIARIDRATDQTAALSALLEEAGHYASRAVLFLTFTDGVRGWASFGFGDEVKALDSLTIDTAKPPFAEFMAERGPVPLSGDDCDPICVALDGDAADQGLLLPMVLRERVAAALYADRIEATDTFVPSALAILVHATAQQIESHGQRRAGASPTLAAAGTVEALEFWDPSAVVSGSSRTSSEPDEAAPNVDATVRISRDVMESYITAPEPDSIDDASGDDDREWDQRPEPDIDLEDEILDLAEEAEETAEAEEVTATAPSSSALEALDAELQAAELEVSDSEDSDVVEPGVVSLEEAYGSDLDLGDDLEEAPELTVGDLDLEPLEDAEDVDLEVTSYAGSTVEEITVEEMVVEEVEIEAVEIEAVEIDEPFVEEVEELEVDDFSIEDVPTADLPTASAEPPSVGRDTSELQQIELEEPSATIALSTPSVVEFRDTPAMPDRSEEDEGDGSEDKTAMLHRADLDIQPAEVVEPPPASPEPVAPPKGSSTQVTPPADLEGPGWAFRQEASKAPAVPGADAETTALHEEARRLARLLVSEIKLYNEEQVDDGRRNGDIYSRLQDDIERSRQMYRDRVDSRVGTDVDYFQQELVNILAGGDPNALGM